MQNGSGIVCALDPGRRPANNMHEGDLRAIWPFHNIIKTNTQKNSAGAQISLISFNVR
ncbi:hypothetical protein SAMN04487996_110120 [Dyadobacter soli]|uniref:Uncharacterized protein n=1 Tax=Dyadobacter soli TaxID=659014 RepID=A0A1G7KHM5_9BACT|nr:hypothetical protein SAMN04487996_110120 [Dyadobacter soli]